MPTITTKTVTTITTPLLSWTLDELRDAFTKVHAAHDWRAPFHAVIDVADAEITEAAVIWFVGEKPTFEKTTKDGTVLVRSVGYREGPCGS